MHLATQGSSKELKKYVQERYARIIPEELGVEETRGLNDFLKAVGKGI